MVAPCTINALFAARAQQAPGAPAVVAGDASLSYQRLDRTSNALAAELRSSGVRQGDLVMLYTDRTPRAVAAILAILKAGAGYVPVDAAYPVERAQYVLEQSRAPF